MAPSLVEPFHQRSSPSSSEGIQKGAPTNRGLNSACGSWSLYCPDKAWINKMKFGIFSNGLRGNENVAATYDEDVAEIEAADRFGFDEAWVSEHMGGWLPDPVALADLLIARAAG